jgi:gas vesicle protein
MHDPVEKTMTRAIAPSGFLLGALVGAGIALLLAPAPGSESRRWVGKTVKGWRNNGADLAREGVDKARELKNAAQSAVESGREAFTRARESQGDPSRPRS